MKIQFFPAKAIDSAETVSGQWDFTTPPTINGEAFGYILLDTDGVPYVMGI